MALQLTSKMRAINTVLEALGESPVNHVDDLLEAQQADDKIEEVSREIQSDGWWFNTEDNYPLPLGTDGQIRLPANALKVDLQSPHFTARGLRVYDKLNHTYIFEHPLRCTIAVGLEWDELPEVARTFVKYRSAKLLQASAVGSPTLYKFHQAEYQIALRALRKAEIENGNYSLWNNAEFVAMTNRSTGTNFDLTRTGFVGNSR